MQRVCMVCSQTCLRGYTCLLERFCDADCEWIHEAEVGMVSDRQTANGDYSCDWPH